LSKTRAIHRECPQETGPRFEKFREALARADLPGASPLAIALHFALRDNPSWGGELPSWLAVALWAHEYAEGKPTREEVSEALEELCAPPSNRGVPHEPFMGHTEGR
jgi:hypothetical protein